MSEHSVEELERQYQAAKEKTRVAGVAEREARSIPTGAEEMNNPIACPLCEGAAEVVSLFPQPHPGATFVQCTVCKCAGPKGEYSWAIAAWNRRAANSAGGVVSELQQAVDEAPPADEDVYGSPAVEAEPVAEMQVLTIAHRIQEILSKTLTVDEGEIMMVGPASYKIARLFKPAPHPSIPVSAEVTVDAKVLQSAVCDALLNAFPLADKIADNYAAVSVRALFAALNGGRENG